MKMMPPNHIGILTETVAYVTCCTSCLVFVQKEHAEEAMPRFPKARDHMKEANYEDGKRYLAAVLRHALALLETGKPPEGKR